MIRSLPIAAMAGGFLVLAGCAPLAVEDPHPDAGTQMWNVASRLEQDRRAGGMAGTIADIQHCYDQATMLVVKVWALRECLVLDYEAHRIDVLVGRRINGGPLPYFEDRTYLDRISKYANLDGFTSAAQLAHYMGDAGPLVELDMAQMNQAPVVVHGPLKPMLAKHF